MKQHNVNGEIVKVAREMLNGNINLLIGCRIITGLHSRADEPQDDIFMVFRAVDSETDCYPLGVARELCDTEYLERVDEEIQHYLSTESECIRVACRNLIEKLSNRLNSDELE